MLLGCMLKFKRLACGSDDVTQYNTIRTGFGLSLMEKKCGIFVVKKPHFSNFLDLGFTVEKVYGL